MLDDQFKWSDGSIVSFKNWVEGGSADWDIPVMDKCVVMHSSTGKWNNVSCTEAIENGVVCEAAQSKLQLHYREIMTLHCFPTIFLLMSCCCCFAETVVVGKKSKYNVTFFFIHISNFCHGFCPPFFSGRIVTAKPCQVLLSDYLYPMM